VDGKVGQHACSFVGIGLSHVLNWLLGWQEGLLLLHWVGLHTVESSAGRASTGPAALHSWQLQCAAQCLQKGTICTLFLAANPFQC
jgi:hypothetical protein